MVETDWKEILNYSQRELKQADKEKLCESLSWMEADDIELNFSDLKTLFRLGQDILKFKSEQVNSLHGQVETLKRRYGKAKEKLVLMDSPAKNSDTLETISHQEELIKANKEILEQLYSEIAELENRKGDKRNTDSESSRDALSEMSTVAQLENEVLEKNRHIRTLLNDVKTLEEENTAFKQKLSVFKEKLRESTKVIENLTEQLFGVNSECVQLKAALGKCEEDKAQCKLEIEILNKKLHEKKSLKETVPDTVKTKLQELKEIIKAQQNEINRLSTENINKLEEIKKLKNVNSSCKQHNDYEMKIKVLQDDLAEASRQMVETAELINILKVENNYLKKFKVQSQDQCNLENKNEVNGRKEKNLIKSLQKNITRLTCALHGAEEMIALREKELTEIAAQLQLLQTDDGIKSLLIGLKNKKRQIKIKDEGIKYLVEEVNNLHQHINDLQIENECMRQQLKIPAHQKINTTGFLKDYYDIKQQIVKLTQKIKEKENKLVTVEVDQHFKDKKIFKLSNFLKSLGYTDDKIEVILNDEDIPDQEAEIQTMKTPDLQKDNVNNVDADQKLVANYKIILEENEGLRSSLTDILNCLKDNSTTTSGVLTLECPSLDTVLQSMEVRRAAGWFAPHMQTVLELRAALGGKDALLTALHESRKETFEVMNQLSQEMKKSTELEKKLTELKSGVNNENFNDDKENNSFNFSIGEFGSWVLESDYNNIDVLNKNQLEDIVAKGATTHEGHIKYCLLYFQNKFKLLYDKLTYLSLRALDDNNIWSVKEQHYKSEIEKLKTKLVESCDEDISEPSPGLIESSNNFTIKSKCNILEENYKHIKVLNDNLKNEYVDCRKEALIITSEYERKIQNLMITVIDLSDKLRNSMPIDIFWQQNRILHEYISKYRNIIEKTISTDIGTKDLMAQLNTNKTDIINYFRSYLKTDGNNENPDSRLTKLENSIVQNQLVFLSGELDSKIKEIEHLKIVISDLQKAQNEFMNKLPCVMTDEEISYMKDNIRKITDENKALKENCRGLNAELEIVSTQLQAYSQKELYNEIEVDSLRHQILDLQSTGNNKVLISRLSNEILMAHLQASESLEKIKTLKFSLNKEKQLRLDAEDMLEKQQNIFDIFVTRNNIKFRNIFEIMEILRQQYQGILPLISLEKYSYHANNIVHKNTEIKKILIELEEVRNTLMTKHTVYDQVLNLSNSKCFDEQDSCPHKIKCIMMENLRTLELEHYNKKIEVSEQSRESLLQRYNKLEKEFLLVNQYFKASTDMANSLCDSANGDSFEIEDVHSDTETNKTGNETYTISSKARQAQSQTDLKIEKENPIEMKSIQTQTVFSKKENKGIQSEEFQDVKDLKKEIEILKIDKNKQDKNLNDILLSNNEQSQLIDHLNSEKIELKKENSDLKERIRNLTESNKHKDELYETLQSTTKSLKGQLNDLKNNQISQVRWQNETSEENKSLLLTIKKIENDKKQVTEEYKKLLSSEREEFARLINTFQSKLDALRSQLDQNGSKIQGSNEPQVKESEELNTKINELEDKCFKLNTDLKTCESNLKACKSELERWKSLASERLKKMEQLSSQIKERYGQEVESYKAENDHWLVQLNETQREHLELRTRLTEQKTFHVKQLADKDAHIEHLRSIINNLKTQIMNMQTMISLNDPSFDLSAIVEVEEASDAISHQDSDRLELKFESSGDLNDLQDDMGKFPSSSTVIWQEPLIERLRREKQLMSKQNAILRKQIKALAGRERRARLDAQNLKNQVFRISTSGHKVPSAESAALQNKIASLQAQLTSARRDSHSTVALWDKWKRAQQSSERWQSRYEEKCQEVIKLESSLTLAKTAVQRLEKEKRVLLSRLSEEKSVKPLAFEKHVAEPSEKSALARREYCESPPPLSTRTLLERVEAQQRRIVALELAERGNEPLVSEYEKSLAEITSLKGQVLKLESALLEAQIKSPLRSSRENNQSDLDYWKSYCDMLKEENMQLTLRVSSLERATSPLPHQRVNDLEQTVLTLRSLVSKLQAEQRAAGASHKRPDSRPASGRNVTDKNRNTNIEMYRTEISNLKRSIQEKDLLLEKSKEMLKIAAEREEDLLRENMMLRRRLEQVTEDKGFLSA